ncbi:MULTISPECIES: hypothetical protein [Enterococcus]|jgi:hypothetical protein|uniref:Uncharacterized protein n=1 Tax=Enterococcus dispar ATCC 51266 TaxID=1139219 RepID=S0K6L4_9ENTE|nr:hypothetical protein [Enterococcus dispar]EOT40187.1 hypothetical protein OMK_02039 [Enterococcus dispar ATCC 51266]EOW86530.1 hypothetical protein I569_01865 [Enterococcus dispar ATCC 51266]MCU7357444.1 TMEM43 family protein [Enterococcus dispar]MDT2705972.1 hypothetical protein [Enterococcus dispar]OJG39506.1 hypothetical protein RV01_GL001453 [Enterococcus dispar]
MENNSMLMRILMFIGFLFVAGIILNLVLGIAGSLIAFVFRFGIPLLIAIVLVRWLTGASTKRNNRRYY